MNQLFFSAAVASMLFTACINQGEQATYPSNIPPAALPDSIAKVPELSSEPVAIKPGAADPLDGIDTTSKLNPAHGEPGHRCDVPVGAPLSAIGKSMGMSLCKTNK